MNIRMAKFQIHSLSGYINKSKKIQKLIMKCLSIICENLNNISEIHED
jgi:hypothetical protein